MRNAISAAPLPLRLAHLLVFGAFAFGGVWLARPELARVLFTARHGYALGAPLDWVLLATALGCAGAFLTLVAAAWRGQRLLPPSMALLLAFGGAVLASHARPDEASWAGADEAILQAAETLQLSMNAQLQKQGEVTANAEDWQRRAAELGPTPVKRDGFRAEPYRVVLIDRDAPLPGPVPGTLAVEVSADRASFQIHPTGVDPTGAPAYLTDAKGAPVLLKATFNPNRPSGEAAGGL